MVLDNLWLAAEESEAVATALEPKLVKTRAAVEQVGGGGARRRGRGVVWRDCFHKPVRQPEARRLWDGSASSRGWGQREEGGRIGDVCGYGTGAG